MSKSKARRVMTRKPLAVLLLAAAVVMLVVAYQTVTTDQYRLYSKNYSYYLSKAEECRAMEGSELSAHYAYLAAEWENTADIAGQYLAEHRAGAVSLGVVSALAIVGGVRLLLPQKNGKKEKNKAPDKAP